jgi:uncharacterized protein YbjT (DUF2867 family)
MAEQSRILVTGATGKVGQEVVSGLLGSGADVRALTRNHYSAGLPDGVEVVSGDLFELDTLHTSLEGVGSVFLV